MGRFSPPAPFFCKKRRFGGTQPVCHTVPPSRPSALLSGLPVLWGGEKWAKGSTLGSDRSGRGSEAKQCPAGSTVFCSITMPRSAVPSPGIPSPKGTEIWGERMGFSPTAGSAFYYCFWGEKYMDLALSTLTPCVLGTPAQNREFRGRLARRRSRLSSHFSPSPVHSAAVHPATQSRSAPSPRTTPRLQTSPSQHPPGNPKTPKRAVF